MRPDPLSKKNPYHPNNIKTYTFLMDFELILNVFLCVFLVFMDFDIILMLISSWANKSKSLFRKTLFLLQKS